MLKEQLIGLVMKALLGAYHAGNSDQKKTRRSSIRPAKEIVSVHADTILKDVKKNEARLPKKNEELKGKKSLAYLVWALGHAHRAEIKQGISVHDVSALLYRANKIELYPINISRVLHTNGNLVRQISHYNRTKTYLLSEEGEHIFRDKFL